MISLILTGIKQRAAALLSIVIAAALGSALIVLCGSMFETGIRLSAPPERLPDAGLVVIGDPDYRMLDSAGERTTDLRPYAERARLPEDAVGRAGGVAGVIEAVPIRFFDIVASGNGDSVPLAGQNMSSLELSGLDRTETDDAGPSEVILSASAAEMLGAEDGGRITLTVGGVSRVVTVAAVVGTASSPNSVFLGEDIEPESHGLIDGIGVVVSTAAEESTVSDGLTQALDDVRVLSGDRRGAIEDPAVSAARTPTIVVGAVFGGIVLTVLSTVVSGIVSLAVRQRSREMSLLRATGATGRQARALLVGEVGIAGAVGAVVGLTLGVPLARLLFTAMVSNGVVPEIIELRVGVVSFAIALVATVAVVWLAASAAARPARRARAIDALRDAELPRARIGVLRWVFGIAFGLGAIALGIITTGMPPALVSATAGPAVLAGSISAASLAPVHLRIGVALLKPLLGGIHRGVAGLARENVRGRIASLATVTAAAALVVGVGAGNLVSQALLTAAANRAQVQTVDASAFMHADAGIDGEIIAELEALLETGAVSMFVSSGGWIEEPFDGSHPDRPWPLRGVTGPSADEVLSNRVTAGELADLTGATIGLPERTAEDLGLQLGDRVSLRFGDSTAAELTVVATFDDLSGYEHLILPAELLAGHTTSRTPTTALVSASGGASPESLMSALREMAAGQPGSTAGDRDGLETSLQQGLSTNALINSLLILVVLAYAMIAVTNTVAISVLGRRRELALLNLAGSTRRQTQRILLVESAIATAAGVVVGAAVACCGILPTALVVGDNPIGPQSAVITVSIVATVIAITLSVTALAVRRATSGLPGGATVV